MGTVDGSEPRRHSVFTDVGQRREQLHRREHLMKTSMETLAAPFPYFGGKSRAVLQVWQAFGAVGNYVEPFAGSAAMVRCKNRRLVVLGRVQLDRIRLVQRHRAVGA